MKYHVVASRIGSDLFHVVRNPEQDELVTAALLNEPRPPYVRVYQNVPWHEARRLKERLENPTPPKRTAL